MTGRVGPRLYLASGVLFGVSYFAYALAVSPELFGINYEVYHVAAEAALAGRDFYAVAPARRPEYRYLYPPPTVLAFLPSTLAASWVPGYLVHTAVTGLVAAGLAGIVVRLTQVHGVELGWLDRLLVFGFVLGSAHAMPSLVFGQVNHHVALGVAAGLYWAELDRSGPAGVALAGAAFLKLFPALVGVWLCRRRAWRAVVAAVATGLVLCGLSVAAFGPETNVQYLTEVLVGRTDETAFQGGLAPNADYLTLWRPLSVAFPGGSPLLWGTLAIGLLALPVGYCYTAAGSAPGRLAAATATLVAVLLALPSYPVYYPLLFGALVPLTYVLDGRPGRVVLVGAVLSNLTVRFGDVRTAIEQVSPGPETTRATLAAAEPVFTAGTPALYGLLIVLGGCVLAARAEGQGAAGRSD